MTRSEARNQKRKEVVEAIILRKESATVVARVYNLSGLDNPLSLKII